MPRIRLALALTLCVTLAPLATDAQQQRIPRIGYLSLGAAIPPDAFVQRLREFGYSEKRSIAIEYRFGEGWHDLMNTLARELVDVRVDIIMAFGDQAIAAAKTATSTIPIVM